MSKTLHLVVIDGGAYSDKWTSFDRAFTTKEGAERYIEEKEQEHAKLIEIGNQLEKMYDEYIKSHPYPEIMKQTFTPKPIPYWKSGLGKKDITPEMLAERDAIMEENRLNSNAFYAEREKASIEYHAERVAAAKKLLEEAGIPETMIAPNGIDHSYVYYYGKHEDVRYSIEELEVFDE